MFAATSRVGRPGRRQAPVDCRQRLPGPDLLFDRPVARVGLDVREPLVQGREREQPQRRTRLGRATAGPDEGPDHLVVVVPVRLVEPLANRPGTPVHVDLDCALVAAEVDDRGLRELLPVADDAGRVRRLRARAATPSRARAAPTRSRSCSCRRLSFRRENSSALIMPVCERLQPVLDADVVERRVRLVRSRRCRWSVPTSPRRGRRPCSGLPAAAARLS